MCAIKGQTNIISSRFGTGSLRGIGKEAGKFVVMTMDIPWHVTKDLIGSTPQDIIFINSVEQQDLDRQIDLVPPCDSVLGIGGGQAVDAAKYMAWKRNIRLITIPTILSVDAFVTPAAGVPVGHGGSHRGHPPRAGDVRRPSDGWRSLAGPTDGDLPGARVMVITKARRPHLPTPTGCIRTRPRSSGSAAQHTGR